MFLSKKGLSLTVGYLQLNTLFVIAALSPDAQEQLSLKIMSNGEQGQY